MITVLVDLCKPISQVFYEEIINQIHFPSLKCPKCKHSACLTIHAYYDRSVKVDGELVALHICRVRCSECGCTHAVLLSSIVPNSQASLNDQVSVILEEPDVMNQNPLIDDSSRRYIRKQFHKHWQQKLISGSINLTPISELIRNCFSQYCRQFMQIKALPNILFLQPT